MKNFGLMLSKENNKRDDKRSVNTAKTFEEIKFEFDTKLVNMAGKTPGKTRSSKGILTVNLLQEVLFFTAADMGLNMDLVRIETNRKINIPFVNYDYLERIDDLKLKNHFFENPKKLNLDVEADVVFFYNNTPLLIIEAKSYSENTMFKRFALELFKIKKDVWPTVEFVLFQLESGFAKPEYLSEIGEVDYGFHAISAWLGYPVSKITMLEGQRRPKKPIHNNDSIKTITRPLFYKAVNDFKSILKKQLNIPHSCLAK